MGSIFFVCALVAMILTAVSLGVGLTTMLKDKDTRDQFSNKLMRWRILLQAAAIVFLFLAFATSGGS